MAWDVCRQRSERGRKAKAFDSDENNREMQTRQHNGRAEERVVDRISTWGATAGYRSWRVKASILRNDTVAVRRITEPEERTSLAVDPIGVAACRPGTAQLAFFLQTHSSNPPAATHQNMSLTRRFLAARQRAPSPRRHRQFAADGQFQIRGIIDGQAVFLREFGSFREGEAAPLSATRGRRANASRKEIGSRLNIRQLEKSVFERLECRVPWVAVKIDGPSDILLGVRLSSCTLAFLFARHDQGGRPSVSSLLGESRTRGTPVPLQSILGPAVLTLLVWICRPVIPCRVRATVFATTRQSLDPLPPFFGHLTFLSDNKLKGIQFAWKQSRDANT